MVARGVGGDRVPPRWKPEEQDAGDHKGPHHHTSAALAPTDRPASVDVFWATARVALAILHRPSYRLAGKTCSHETVEKRWVMYNMKWACACA